MLLLSLLCLAACSGEVIAPPQDDTDAGDMTCGDTICGGDEDCSTCPDDCGVCEGVTCGDGTCDLLTESCDSCAEDCGECLAECNDDGTCDANETCTSCELDCGECATNGNTCGDDTCGTQETCSGCPEDCGDCPAQNLCGNSTCDTSQGENCNTCSSDCGQCTQCSFLNWNVVDCTPNKATSCDVTLSDGEAAHQAACEQAGCTWEPATSCQLGAVATNPDCYAARSTCQ